MSYIDSYDHELVGFFAGLPLYHPLEDIAPPAYIGVGPQNEDFSCTTQQLVLGGGSGEHPGLVLTNPGAAALHFLRAALPLDQPISEQAQRLFDKAWSYMDCLAFAGWNLETTASFVARCTGSAFMRPYSQEIDGTLEQWLLCNLGEFVYFAMPELAADVLAQIPSVCALVREPRYGNVLILPPGYTMPYGRARNATGNVVWGNYRWATQKKQPEQL